MSETRPDRRMFVSHKHEERQLASLIVAELENKDYPIEFYLSEEIEKSKKWEVDIAKALRKSDFLLFIYTNANWDWSWCIYEVLLFLKHGRRTAPDNRRLYCLHFDDCRPHVFLDKYQTISVKAKGTTGVIGNNIKRWEDVERWLIDLYNVLHPSAKIPSQERASAHADNALMGRIRDKAQRIERIFQEFRWPRSKLDYVGPWVWVHPEWPTNGGPKNWNKKPLPLDLLFGHSKVRTDEESHIEYLNVRVSPEGQRLSDFLKSLEPLPRLDKLLDPQPTWIQRFYDALKLALDGDKADETPVYFRFSDEKIRRPIFDCVEKSRDGSKCRCRVIFVRAFSPPPEDQPQDNELRKLQRLAIILRLAVRTRLELLEKYRGKMAELRARSDGFPPGKRAWETLDTIALEAKLRRLTSDEVPGLFVDKDQGVYDDIVGEFEEWFGGKYEKLQEMMFKEDASQDKKYDQTERALDKLQELNRRFMEIAIPRFHELFLQKRAGKGVEAAELGHDGAD